MHGQTFHLGNRSLSGNERNELFRNDGSHYSRVGFVSGAMNKLDARGFVPADFDRDGDIDLLVVNNRQPVVYLENKGAVRNWSVVQLEGSEDNRFGIGARVRLTTKDGTQTRELHLGSGFLSSPPPEAHFGLGDATAIERIEVRWPNGKTQTIDTPEPNKIVVISQAGGSRYLTPRRRTP